MAFFEKVKCSISETTQKVKDGMANIKVEDITSNLNIYEKYFSESQLWDKLKQFGKTIGATILYPVLLLFTLLKSGDVNLKEKAMIVGTLGYFILPVDLLPDALVGVGYTDDMMALTATLTALASCITEEMQQEAKDKLKELVGEFDEAAIDKVTQIIQSAHLFVNKSKK
jgi:uncharacterized membrane protein YkvA (DUF1232 family)